ncbi:TetR/AcrR family transcriptional regulator [Glaciimonas sp. PCH181]|uniref:TetR/AcrR family transcriptional regulator n=1 Tax=Glaciimonas sp. PCH181 TaxID=2133943 RepID=UPI000D335B59|nr:TetR/AcrR family transcriptional regulator [Glaciimonas sp. PCH181]PUA20427.1 TetR/AcrR family transcriptional regulator [Glaciimonas sp. PCH181]
MSLITNRPRRSGEHRTSAASRERILDASFEVICEDGYSGATMAKVAKKAELPVGSVYWHFENKDLLLAALIETSFERWHSQIISRHQPLPGEAFEQHIERIFGNSEADRQYDAADFWRLGVILSVEKSVREQVARERFLKIRQIQRAELASWWHKTVSAELLAHDPDLPERLSGFTLALLDGNAIAGASGEAIQAFRPMLASSLIHLVSQATVSLAAATPQPAPVPARKARKARKR